MDEGYILLAGAIIRRARLDYYEAWYHKYRGDTQYYNNNNNPIYTEKEIEMLDEFFNSGWYELLSMGKVDADYIMENEKKEAKFMAEVSMKIEKLETEKIIEIIKLCKKVIKARKNNKESDEFLSESK